LEKYHGAGQATNDNVGHAVTCLTRRAKNTHSEYVILVFHCKNGCTNAPHCHVIRKLPTLCQSYYR